MSAAGKSEGSEIDARGESGITRREALRRGTMAGFGLVWVAPRVDSFTISAQTAQATSGVDQTDPISDDLQEDDRQENEEPEGDQGTEGNQEPEGKPETEVSDEQIDSDTDPGPEVSSDQDQEAETDQGATVSSDEVQGKVVSGETLPFTGLPVEQLLPLAGGAIATGAAIVRLSKERDGREKPDEPGQDSV